MAAAYAPALLFPRAKAARTGPYKASADGAGKPDDDAARQVYVGNLPFKLKWQELKDHFKAVGAVENARILTEDGTERGRSRGVGIVRFETEVEAQAAVAQLNESELAGRNIVVDAWTGSSGKWKQEMLKKGGNGRTAGTPMPNNGQTMRPGDWICPICQDLQFARNATCRNCGTGGQLSGKSAVAGGLGANGQDVRPGDWICTMCNDLQFARNAACRNCGAAAKGKGAGKGFGKGGGKGYGEVRGENLVYVGNLAYEVRWQDLKDHMKQAGTVEFCNVMTQDGTEWGKSKGVGCVRYSSAAEVEQAIAMLSESDLKGRKILVDHWTSSSTPKAVLT